MRASSIILFLLAFLFTAGCTGNSGSLSKGQKAVIAFNDSVYKWTINFDVIFNWNYPDESFRRQLYTQGSGS